MRTIKLERFTFALASACAILSGCAGSEPSEESPTASGTLIVRVSSTDQQFVLEQADGTSALLHVDHMKETSWPGTDEPIDWRSAGGSPVEVFGVRNADGSIEVERMEPPEGVVSTPSALTDANGIHHILAVRLVIDGRPLGATEQDVKNTLSVVQSKFVEYSFGKMRPDYKVVGPFTAHSAPGVACDVDKWRSQVLDQVKASGVDPQQFDHISYIANWPTACGFAGLGEVPGRNTWIWDASGDNIYLHELGHNLGNPHASTLTCTKSGKGVPLSDQCKRTEYGDPFDVMGAGGWQHNDTAYSQYNGAYKARIGWIPPSQIATVTGDQTFTLLPMTKPSAAGLELLRVPGPNGTEYTVEYRQPVNPGDVEPGSASLAGVFIHVMDSGSKPSFGGWANQSYLLDMHPGDAKTGFDDAALHENETYTFLGTNTTLKVISISPAEARVQIIGGGGGSGGGGGGGGGGDANSLVSVGTGKCVGVRSASNASGARVIQWSCTGAKDQSWQFQSNDGGQHVVLKDVNSGMCLDSVGENAHEGAPIEQATCNGHASQTWKVVTASGGKFSLRSSGSGKCVTVSGASTADGAPFIQYTCHSTPTQQFTRR